LQDEVRKFVEAMKNPDFVLEGCQLFVEEEQRDAVYMAALSYRLTHDSQNDMILSMKALLASWNWRLLMANPHLRHSLENDVRNAVSETNDIIQELQAERLGRTAIDQQLDRIAKAFKAFADRHSIGTTGASKALHVINPNLFVMWDNTIKTNYHRLHDDYGVRYSPIGECYAKFLKNCNEIAGALRENEIEQLTVQHPSFKTFGFRKSLPKMIDECNFVRFFLNKKWE